MKRDSYTLPSISVFWGRFSYSYSRSTQNMSFWSILQFMERGSCLTRPRISISVNARSARFVWRYLAGQFPFGRSRHAQRHTQYVDKLGEEVLVSKDCALLMVLPISSSTTFLLTPLNMRQPQQNRGCGSSAMPTEKPYHTGTLVTSHGGMTHRK